MLFSSIGDLAKAGSPIDCLNRQTTMAMRSSAVWRSARTDLRPIFGVAYDDRRHEDDGDQGVRCLAAIVGEPGRPGAKPFGATTGRGQSRVVGKAARCVAGCAGRFTGCQGRGAVHSAPRVRSCEKKNTAPWTGRTRCGLPGEGRATVLKQREVGLTGGMAGWLGCGG